MDVKINDKTIISLYRIGVFDRYGGIPSANAKRNNSYPPECIRSDSNSDNIGWDINYYGDGIFKHGISSIICG
jgi:hypothetical protein